MRVDLVLIGGDNSSLDWRIGEVHHSNGDIRSINNHLRMIQVNADAEAILLWGAKSQLPLGNTIIGLLQNETIDVWHAGISCGLKNQPESLKYVAPNWMFFVDPPEGKDAVSWRLSLQCCLIRRNNLEAYGLPLESFRTVEAAGLEYGHRLIHHGAIIKHSPSLYEGQPQLTPKLPYDDQCQFIFHRYGKKWAYWFLINTFLKNPIGSIRTYRLMNQWTEPERITAHKETLPPTESATRISVILPTLSRYDYIPGCLESLKNQSQPISEIIIIDQNTPTERRPEIYAQFSDLPIKVIWQDQKGQCTARNAGVLAAGSEWLFFADDDSEYQPDVIANHLAAVNHYQADASTGLSIPPREYKIPEEYQFIRLAYDLDTGNCLIKRDSLIEAGGFDLIYDFGKGADQDLGMRIYLSGGMIIHNPQAIRVHYKAPGGLRNYGVLWNSISIGDKTPKIPATILYYYMRYFPRESLKQGINMALITNIVHNSQIKDKQVTNIVKELILSIPTLPLALWHRQKRMQEARELFRRGPLLLK